MAEHKSPEVPVPKQPAVSPAPKKKPSLRERVRHLFRHDRLKQHLKQVADIAEGEKHREELRKQLFSPTVKKKKVKRVRHSLAELLRKAGLSIDSHVFKKRVFLGSVIVSLVLSIVVLVLASVYQKGAVNVLVFMAGFWSMGFSLILLLASLFVAAWLDLRINARRKQVEEVLPDFLQLAAANIGAGMTIDRALWYAVRPRFGVLAKEIEDVAKQVLTGAELPDAMRGFSEHYESPIVRRSVSLLLEGVAAGGKIADLLHKIATDIQEQRILQKEMAANVTTYVIFISFASVLAAPVLFGLATQLLVVIQTIAAHIGTSASPTGTLSVTPDVVKLSDFRIFCMVVLTATSTLSGMIISVIRKGELTEGLRFLPFFLTISLTLYFLAVAFFGHIFGSLI